ncbi:hypothetical protein TCAL_07491, partial [Tigriopus californicus]
ATLINPNDTIDGLIVRIEKWHTIINILTRIRRLSHKIKIHKSIRFKHDDNKMLLPLADTEWAETQLIIIQRAQELSFSKEIKVLKIGPLSNSNKLPKASLLRSLNIFWDKKFRVIRLKTRIHLAETFSERFRYPIIVPKGEIAKKLILHVHQQRYHLNQKHTQFELRRQFWILGGYNYIKQIVRSCKTPRCRYIKFENPRMSPLPPLRLDHPVCFTNVGVDYVGPLLCRHDCDEEARTIVDTDPKPFQMIAFQDMWLKRKQVLNSFWSRWTKDYLEQLSVSPKWTKSNKNNLNVGDVVLLKNETLTKNVWQLARIKQLLRNKDDLATKVLVQMPQGHVLERTMRQVALLESHQDLPMKVDSPEERNQLLGGPMIAVGSERRGGQPNFHRPRVKDQPPERLPTVDSTNVNVDAPEIVAETNSCSPVDASVAPREIKKKRKRHPRVLDVMDPSLGGGASRSVSIFAFASLPKSSKAVTASSVSRG